VAQLSVAWAGEAGEERRLGWWRTDMVSEFGGEDLFRRLLPDTWRWAVLEAAREAARRRDAELRAQLAEPDSWLTLFALGAAVDEQVTERLAHHKRTTPEPTDALPGLRDIVRPTWDRDAFAAWLTHHGRPDVQATPAGRRLKTTPDTIDALVAALLAALSPLSDAYPLPHARRPA
jgi:hypothetical protein